MIGRYYNNYDDDDDDDDYYDSYCNVGQVEESPKEEENFSINNLNENEMEGNFRALEMSWFITIMSTKCKCEYKLAVISIVSIKASKATVEITNFDNDKYYDLEFITSAGRFVCKGVYYGNVKYSRFSDLKSWIDDIKLIQCDSVEFTPWACMHNVNPDNDNHADQLNPNNDEYYHSRGED